MSNIHKIFPLFFLLFVIYPYFLSGQMKYKRGHTQYTLTDPSRNSRKIPLEIFYPSASSGDNVPVAEGTFPLIVFGHGFMMKWSSYISYADSLAARGYVIVFPVTETSLLPSYTDFAKDLAFTATSLLNESGNPSSAFFRKLTDKCALAGHSMGGGCAVLAAQFSTVISAHLLLAPLNISPGTIEQAKNISAPALIYSGTKDCITTVAQNQQPVFNALVSISKSLLNITGGTHCQFAESDTYCRAGELLCLDQPFISFTDQKSIVFSTMFPWLDYVLKGDHSKANEFQKAIKASSKLSVQQNVALSAAESDIKNSIVVFPNPVRSNAFLLSDLPQGNYLYRILDAQGKSVAFGKVAGRKTELPVCTLKPGYYVINLFSEKKEPLDLISVSFVRITE
jgi:dienelactone hydrolase